MLVREDGIHEPGFALELAARRLGQAPQPAGAGWRLGDWMIPGSETNALLLNFARGTAIPTYSLADLNACVEAGRTDYLREHFAGRIVLVGTVLDRSEEHTSELQSLMRISYAVFCLKKKKAQYTNK